jgi:hypothetical protein
LPLAWISYGGFFEMIGNGIGVVITSVMPALGGRQTVWFGGSLSSSRRRKGFTFKFLDFLVNELWVMSRLEKSLITLCFKISSLTHCTVERMIRLRSAGTKWFWGKFGSCHIE